MHKVSTRAEIVTRRTYNRPIDEANGIYEDWTDTVDRVIDHQRWLWERALTHNTMKDMPLHDVTEDMKEWVHLNQKQWEELAYIRQLMLERKISPSGRTLWLGGTNIAKTREASQFNCCHVNIETVYDIVDVFWLLLQGTGTGFTPVVGTLNGFKNPIDNIEIIRSSKKDGERGRENNEEHFENQTWYISVGDSAEAWAKSVGKILAGKFDAKKLILDFSQIRCAGQRLNGYGWVSSGDSSISKAYPKIIDIMNIRAGNLLRKIDILDIMNLLGTVLSSRRSAEIALVDYGSDEWREFANAKKHCYEPEYLHRQQSNNSLVFYQKPTRGQVDELFTMMIENGGSEPAFVNGESAKKRAPWFAGLNPSLRGDTLVYTNIGVKPIKELENKEFKVLSMDDTMQRATCRMSSSNEKLWKISLEGGQEYYCSKEHEWPVTRRENDKWMAFEKFSTDKLKAGDALKIEKRDYLYNGNKGSYDEGFFIGWIQGDGYVNTKTNRMAVVVSKKETEIMPLLKNIISKYSKANFNESKRDNLFELGTKNENLVKYILSLGFIDKENIPSSIYNPEYSEEFRKGYIDGIFSSDGYIPIVDRGCKRKISLTSSRYNFIYQISELLGFYGIKSSITKSSCKKSFNGNPVKEYFEAHVKVGSYDGVFHFNKLFKLSVNHKQKRLETFEKPKSQLMVEKSKIKNIEETDLYDKVYDIGVYNDQHTFRLSHGFTGNCAEILLGNKSFCNLVEVDLAKFKGNSYGLDKAMYYAARMNYRQTIVDFRDGILQEAWHLNNTFLRLCGVGVTGISQRDDLTEYDWKDLRYSAVSGARSIAKELKLELPKNVTTVKPSGTLSKIMDSTEGVHKPDGQYLFNWINFSNHDPIVEKLKNANYKWMINPADSTGTIICIPYKYSDDLNFTPVKCQRKDGTVETINLNIEDAITQLERYKKVQLYYCDQNVSNTIYYKPEEKDKIVDWLLANWDVYVGVSFIFKQDGSMSAKDLGYNYLPQEYITKERYEEYVKTLQEIDWSHSGSTLELDEEECPQGVCPVK